MRRQLVPALRMFLLMTVVTGIVYTAAVTGVAQGLFGERADGSLVTVDGEVAGSELLGQMFTRPEFFHPRPSAVDYDPSGSGATNYGPTNPEFLAAIENRVEDYRQLNRLDPGTAVPVDAVTSSASGLDPHISVANAQLQAARVAEERGLPLERVIELIEANTIDATLGILSEAVVDVLGLNIALETET